VVSVDDRRGAEIATDHLVGLGHKRIAFLDAGSSLGNTEKVEGYRRSLARAGIPFDQGLVIDPRGHSAIEGYRAFAGYLDGATPRPTALLASNDLLAFGALRACRERGLDVPGDLALVGIDDIEASDYAPVPLTTVHYAADELSEAAVERLLVLINGPDRLPPAKQIFIEPKLVIRKSCGADLAGAERPRSYRTAEASRRPALS
jgi:LacI family transcriptional regulator